jgi:hypothetical protein
LYYNTNSIFKFRQMEKLFYPPEFMTRTSPSCGEGKRSDQHTGLLGRDLSAREDRLNRFIYFGSFAGPVTVKEIANEFFNGQEEGIREAVWVLVSRLRSKLGEEAIVTAHGRGYLSRRALIEKEVFENDLSGILVSPPGIEPGFRV